MSRNRKAPAMRDLGKKGRWRAIFEPGTDVSLHLVAFPTKSLNREFVYNDVPIKLLSPCHIVKSRFHFTFLLTNQMEICVDLKVSRNFH